MDSWKTWSVRLTFGAALAGAVMSRDACLGGSRPRPEPTPAPTATATAAAMTAAPRARAGGSGADRDVEHVRHTAVTERSARRIRSRGQPWNAG
jgi:hypothetical protein